jgi:hypothetical protein
VFHTCAVLIQTWGVAAAKAGVNLMEGCIAAIDGEKDPRCLLLAFELVQVRVTGSGAGVGWGGWGCTGMLVSEALLNEALLRGGWKAVYVWSTHWPVVQLCWLDEHYIKLDSLGVGGLALGGWGAVTSLGSKYCAALLLTFPCAPTLDNTHPQATARVYHSPSVSSHPFNKQADEMIEVLSCYFPLSFTPPKNDVHK